MITNMTLLLVSKCLQESSRGLHMTFMTNQAEASSEWRLLKEVSDLSWYGLWNRKERSNLRGHTFLQCSISFFSTLIFFHFYLPTLCKANSSQFIHRRYRSLLKNLKAKREHSLSSAPVDKPGEVWCMGANTYTDLKPPLPSSGYTYYPDFIFLSLSFPE